MGCFDVWCGLLFGVLVFKLCEIKTKRKAASSEAGSRFDFLEGRGGGAPGLRTIPINFISGFFNNKKGGM